MNSAWQPIETAPKTGEQILTWCAGITHNKDWYQTSFWSPIHKVFVGWPKGMQPTHWMPLPPREA